MRESRPAARGWLAAAGALALSGLLFSCTALAVLHWTPWLSDYQVDCTLGVNGAAATVEVHGWRAGRACRQALATDAQRSGRGASLYPDAPRQGIVLCRGDLEGLTITVRDQGMLDLVGTTLCRYFGLNGP